MKLNQENIKKITLLIHYITYDIIILIFVHHIWKYIVIYTFLTQFLYKSFVPKSNKNQYMLRFLKKLFFNCKQEL